MIYHYISCVSRLNIEFLFLPDKYQVFWKLESDHEMEILFKQVQDKYKYDCLKFKQYLSLT